MTSFQTASAATTVVPVPVDVGTRRGIRAVSGRSYMLLLAYCSVAVLLSVTTSSAQLYDALPDDGAVLAYSQCSTPSPCFNISVSGAKDTPTFMRDGAPTRIVSGSIHYWRSLPSDWEARLRAVKAVGLNTITTYIHWALHQPEANGEFIEPSAENPALDFVRFIQLAGEVGLNVIVRVGPYITAEVDFGGYPYWIQNVPDIQLRRPNAAYYALIDTYFDWLVPFLVPLQYNDYGGPIIDFQVEDDTDVPLVPDADTHAYYSYLLAGLRSRGIVGLVNVLAWPSAQSLQKAIIPGAWTALEYAVTQNTTEALGLLRQFDKSSPFMVMEFYPAWMDVEGWPHNTMPAATFSAGLSAILAAEPLASVSIYPIHGGTNFGFTAGSDWDPTHGGFSSIITSYDYDTAVREDGDANPTKWTAIRNAIAEVLPLPPQPMPDPSPKGSYGTVLLNESAALLDNIDSLPFTWSDEDALPFEHLNQSYGFVLYRTALTRGLSSPQPLLPSFLMDRAIVLLDGVVQGIVGWAEQASPFGWATLSPASPAPTHTPQLALLVENKGRCSGTLQDFSCSSKGLRGPTRIGATLQPQTGWNMTHLPLDNITSTELLLQWNSVGENNDDLDHGEGSENLFDASETGSGQTLSIPPTSALPTFFRGYFYVDSTPLHSYLLMDGWGHGVAFVNGFALGKFSCAGPARALYVPAGALQPGRNKLVLFETDQKQPIGLDEEEDQLVRLGELEVGDGVRRTTRRGGLRIVSFVPDQLWSKVKTDTKAIEWTTIQEQ